MKTVSTAPALAAMTLAAGLFITQPLFAYTDSTNNEPGKEAPAGKGKLKNASSLNNASVKMHPDIIKREMHVVAKDNNGAEVDFFVFDQEGTIIQHYKIKPRAHYKMSGLKKGKYTYSVFLGDEETASGKFEIR